MFFNEDLYLEGEDVDTTPVSDAEINDAVEESGGLGAVSEDYNFYAAGLEFMNETTEYYYNLREKMMNIEHVAGVKAAQGLVSESNIILSEGVEAFLDKIKDIFTKIKNAIVELFNRFVNFVSSLFVSNTTILNMDVVKEYKDAKNRKGFRLRGRVLNIDVSVMEKDFPESVRNLIKAFKDNVTNVLGIATSLKPGVDAGTVQKKIEATKERIDPKIKDQILSIHKKIGSEVFDKVLPKTESGTYTKSRVNTVLQKQEREIEVKELEDRVKFAKGYRTLITDLKSRKGEAVSTCDDAIKAINKMKSQESGEENSELRKAHGLMVTQLRQDCRRTQAVFAVATNVLSTYYRECMAVARRVIGAARAKRAGDEVRKLGEGFDYQSYFA